MNRSPCDMNRRVLVVDDNPSIHEDFRKILCPAADRTAATEATEAALFGHPRVAVQATSFEVDSAYQGQEGLQRVTRALSAGRPYAMAFVDVRMPPGWDGVETTRNLWAVDPDLQIVLCTAYSDYSWREVFEELGQRDGLLILKKPFDAVEAFQLAHALTEKWCLHQQSRRKVEELEGLVVERTRTLEQINDALEAEVAERKRASEALRTSLEEFRTLAEAMPQIVWTARPDGRSSYINQQWMAYTGFTLEKSLGQGWIKAFHRDDRRPSWKAWRQAKALIQPFSIECRLRRADGAYRWWLIRGVPMQDPAGRVLKWVGTGTDIHDFKLALARLFESQKLETVGTLAGGIAHEFNSILTTILGQCALLLGELPLGSPPAGRANEISQAANRAATLTRQLLAYGRRQILQPDTLDLNHIIANLGGMLRHLLGATVETQILPAPHLHRVKADAGQLEQVVINLVLNARDAMPHGGTLTLETANVSLDPERAAPGPGLKPGPYVMLAITDTGIGMSEEVKAHLFEPFFTTKGVGQGAGLGLSTCYGIVRQSGGDILVSSEPTRGTTFRIYLPQVEPETALLRPPPASLDLPRGTETILLVEDDAALRDMAAALLRRLGYTVSTSTRGIEAISLAQQRDLDHLDLIVVDVATPPGTSPDSSERWRVLFPGVSMLLTSASAEEATLPPGGLPQGVELLHKPYTPTALARKVRKVLDRSSRLALDPKDASLSLPGAERVRSRPSRPNGPPLPGN